MDKFQLISDFIDGELEPLLESQLFLELSSDDELRQKLKNTILLKSALASNLSAFAPSANQTQKLFSALGFKDVLNPPTSTGKIENQGKFLNATKYLMILLLGGFLMFLISRYFTDDIPEKIITKSDNSKHIYDLANQIPPIPIIKNYENEQKLTKSIGNKKNETHLIANESYDYEEFVNAETIQTIMNSEHKIIIESDLFSLQNFTSNTMIELPFVIRNSYPSTRIGKFSIELFNSHYFSSEEPTISPSKNAIFNNSAIKVVYDLSDNITLGAEARQETFYQVFEGMDEFGIINTYRQQPNFTTIGAIGRYKITNWYNFIPFIELNVGTNNAGLVYRGTTGITYSPYHNFNIILNLEYSNLNFMHQQNWFNSNKFGINYGFGIKF